LRQFAVILIFNCQQVSPLLGEKENPISELWQAMTMQLDKRLNECALNLNDGKFLAVLSGGDVVNNNLQF
jgi:hypothetical protein